jgi:hypothetical protein
MNGKDIECQIPLSDSENHRRAPRQGVSCSGGRTRHASGRTKATHEEGTLGMRKAFTSIIMVGVLAFCSGCQSTLKTTYNPTCTPIYSSSAKALVAIAAVKDRRALEGAVYYRNSANGDAGQFDRPIADIVRQAITAECERCGLTVSPPGTGCPALSCEILEFTAAITEPLFRSAILDLKVAVLFEWKDRKNNTTLARNERSERRSRKLTMGKVPSLPFDRAVIQDYGNELLNDMFPRLLEKELQSLSFLGAEQ